MTIHIRFHVVSDKVFLRSLRRSIEQDFNALRDEKTFVIETTSKRIVYNSVGKMSQLHGLIAPF